MTKGFYYRLGIKLTNTGIKYKMRWIILLGDKIRNKGMGEYV